MSVFLFWFAVALLLFIGAGAVAMAFLGKSLFKQTSDTSVSVLSDDYAEIDRDRAAGLLTEKDSESAKDDLRRAALVRSGHRQLTAGKSVKVALAAVVTVVVLSLGLYGFFGEPGLVEVFSAEPEGGLMQADGTLGVNGRTISPEAFQLYLKKRPDDERAWV